MKNASSSQEAFFLMHELITAGQKKQPEHISYFPRL